MQWRWSQSLPTHRPTHPHVLTHWSDPGARIPSRVPDVSKWTETSFLGSNVICMKV